MNTAPTLQELIDLQKNPKPLKRTPMKNTLKPLPSFEAKENTSEPSYVEELRYAFLEGYNEARQEFQKDTERLDWLLTFAKGNGTREDIDEAMKANPITHL